MFKSILGEGVIEIEPTLKMTGITKKFGSFCALENVNFEAYAGKVNVILGENGAGKSTLMKILAGVHQQTEGKIEFEGQEIEIHSIIDARNKGIGTVFQELSLVSNLSVAENLFLGADLTTDKLGFVKWDTMYKEAYEAIKNIAGIEVNPRQKVAELGIAYQQMIEIAKVVNRSVKVLIMDEPTAALTDREIEVLFETIDKLKKSGVVIIYISHRLEEIFKIGDRITVLRDGKLAGTLNPNEANMQDVISMMVGREIQDMYPAMEPVPDNSKEILRVENLTREGVFKNVSFSLREGEILGFAGLMGAGRTEIARAIFGADRYTSGKIYIDGEEVKIKSPRDAIKRGIVLLPEDRKTQGLSIKHSVVNNITIANLKGISSKLGFLNKKAEMAVVKEYVKSLKIALYNVFGKVSELSGGNQQKVVIAKWMYLNPRVIIVDEPTRGIDVGARVEVYNLINEFLKEGKAVLLISSDLPEVLGLCNHVVVIRNGVVAGEFTEAIDSEGVMAAMVGGK